MTTREQFIDPEAVVSTGKQRGGAKSSTINSVLAADFGSVHTRVMLFDLVDGQYRLVSRAQTLSTTEPPINDVNIGLHRALEEMGTLIGRPLSNQQQVIVGERSDASGADVFIATASGGRPMKAVLVGLMPNVSLLSGSRTLGSTYVNVVDTLSLADIRSTEDQVNAILHNRPDLIFIVGGTDYGATAPVIGLLQTVRLAILLARGQKPVVLYAGNEALRPKVQELLGEEAQLFIASNVRPEVSDEKLGPAALELGLVYGAYRAVSGGGFMDVRQQSALGVLPTAQSYSNVMRYLGDLPGSTAGVMCIDVGSSAVTVCATVKKQSYITIRSDMGLGHSAASGVQMVGVDNILRWLTFKASPDDILDYAYNKTLRPSTVPHTKQELEFEYAIARELIRSVVAESRGAWRGISRSRLLPPMRQIIGAGSVLAEATNPGMGALLLLDALQPVGITRLQLDPYGVIAALGGIAYAEPLATVQAIDNGSLLDLGTAVCPTGKPSGRGGIEATVKYASGRIDKRSVPGGAIGTINIPAGQKANVEIKLGAGLRLGGRRRLKLSIDGGAIGLILDARGRPFVVPKDTEKRAEVIPAWIKAVQAGAQ